MSNEIAIIQQENVDMIIQTVPNAFSDNKLSHQRCLAAGDELLSVIRSEGMNDELDQKAASYIEKSRKTLAKMNDKRAPVTKLFDEIRRQFTTLESAVDPAKKDSIPNQLQQLRNEYAARKRAEEEQRRRAAMIEQQRQASMAKYRADVEQELRSFFTSALNYALNSLTIIYQNITLDNYAQGEQVINEYSHVLDVDVMQSPRSTVLIPTNLEPRDTAAIRLSVQEKLIPSFREEYENAIVDRKLELSQLLPSKKAELERAAKASAEEAERIRQEMQQREAAEAARREQERMAQEAKAAAAQQVQQQQLEMTNLFDAAATAVQTYQPKTQVKKVINILNPDGILPVIMMWWQEEGCRSSTDELTKQFKKQITFCEKLANSKDNPILIEHESVCYEEEVKAK